MSDKRSPDRLQRIIALIGLSSAVFAGAFSAVIAAIVAGAPAFTAIVAVGGIILRIFDKYLYYRLKINADGVSVGILKVHLLFRRMQFGASSGLVAEFIKAESKSTYKVVLISIISSIFMYSYGIGDWRFAGGIAALALIRHGLTIYRVTTNRFGTTPDELIELISCLKERDRSGKSPPDHTGLAEPNIQSLKTYGSLVPMASRGA